MMMKRKLIIDTNLLLLLIIGSVENGRHIANSKRLDAFCEKDFQNVLATLKEYDEAYTTPYIAAEVSNLIDLNGDVRDRVFEVARYFFSIFFKEITTKIEHDCSLDFFVNFGLTDSSLIDLSSEYAIFTNDHRMLAIIYGVNPESAVPYIPCKKIKN